MSPEQVHGEELDSRTDLFSFGVVIYEMATGHLPFERKTVGATFAAILHESPEPATRWNSQLPARLDEIISKALQKDRQLRYQHASEIRSDLQQLRAVTKSAPTTPAQTPRASRHRPAKRLCPERIDGRSHFRLASSSLLCWERSSLVCRTDVRLKHPSSTKRTQLCSPTSRTPPASLFSITL